jgi:hypothetical protein
MQMTGFEKMLQELNLPYQCKVLDVGAGGFVGETTTKHLVTRFEHVIAVERDKTACDSLRLKFGMNELKIHCCPIEEFEATYQYDLMVIDLNEPQIPFIKDTLIPYYGKQFVRVGGHIITLWYERDAFHSLDFVAHQYVPKWPGCYLGWRLMERVA